MKTIELTDKQYETLVKLSFIGEWILNAQHSSPEFIEEHKFVNYLYSHCKKFNLENHFKKYGEIWELKEDEVFGILPIIEEFSYNDFWVTLISKLSERDIQEKTQSMDHDFIEEEEYEMMIENSAITYKNEFEQNGIDNLRIRNVRDN